MRIVAEPFRSHEYIDKVYAVERHIKEFARRAREIGHSAAAGNGAQDSPGAVRTNPR
jgi:hypothetical protein